MSRTPQPTARDVQELLAYLPKLYGEGFTPITSWGGGEKEEDGAIVMPWPEYDGVVRDFIEVIARDCWYDYGYVPADVERLIESEAAIKAATLPQIRAMLTYVLRGERFSDGWWGHMIEAGYVRRILERLAELEAEPGEGGNRSSR